MMCSQVWELIQSILPEPQLLILPTLIQGSSFHESFMTQIHSYFQCFILTFSLKPLKYFNILEAVILLQFLLIFFFLNVFFCFVYIFMIKICSDFPEYFQICQFPLNLGFVHFKAPLNTYVFFIFIQSCFYQNLQFIRMKGLSY